MVFFLIYQGNPSISPKIGHLCSGTGRHSPPVLPSLLAASPPPSKWNRGGDPWIPFMGPFSLWGRVKKWNWGTPNPPPLQVGFGSTPLQLGQEVEVEKGHEARSSSLGAFALGTPAVRFQVSRDVSTWSPHEPWKKGS